MNKLYGFLRKKELAPFMLAVCVASFVASVWLCIINYKTTYSELLGRLPQDASIALTIFVQGFEFLIPILALLGVIKSLELSKELRFGLYITWAAVMVIDFVTAYVYLLGWKQMAAQWSDYVIALAVSLLFLFGELFVVLSGTGLVVSFVFWRTGSIPQWSPSAPSAAVHTETGRSTARPIKMLRDSGTRGKQLWRFSDNHQEWLPKNDPRLSAVAQQ